MPTTTIAAIDRQLDFRASPERLWRALTEDGELASWFGQRAQLDLRPGGDGWLEFEGYGRVPVRIDVFEPVTRLSWRWGDAGKSVDEGSTLVEFRLEPLAGGGTRLHLRESGFEREDSALEQHRGLGDRAGRARQARRGRAVRGRHPPDLRADVAARPRLARVQRAGRARRLVGGHARSRDPARLRGLVRLAQRGRPVRDAVRGRRAAALPVLDLDARAGGPARRRPTTVLRTEWTLVPREDGGTDLHLFESGFTEPTGFGMNSGGWDDDILPALRRHLGEAS